MSPRPESVLSAKENEKISSRVRAGLQPGSDSDPLDSWPYWARRDGQQRYGVPNAAVVVTKEFKNATLDCSGAFRERERDLR